METFSRNSAFYIILFEFALLSGEKLNSPKLKISFPVYLLFSSVIPLTWSVGVGFLYGGRYIFIYLRSSLWTQISAMRRKFARTPNRPIVHSRMPRTVSSWITTIRIRLRFCTGETLLPPPIFTDFSRVELNQTFPYWSTIGFDKEILHLLYDLRALRQYFSFSMTKFHYLSTNELFFLSVIFKRASGARKVPFSPNNCHLPPLYNLYFYLKSPDQTTENFTNKKIINWNNCITTYFSMPMTFLSY